MKLSTRRKLRQSWRRDREWILAMLFTVGLLCSSLLVFGYADPDNPQTEARP